MPTVLVVDDDDAVRRVLTRSLQREGCVVIEADNGQAALDCLRSAEPVDVILLDLRMPVMSGWTFRQQQRLDPKIGHIPVIVLSGADEDRFHELDAAAVFHKPTVMADVVACVRGLSEGTKEPKNSR